MYKENPAKSLIQRIFPENRLEAIDNLSSLTSLNVEEVSAQVGVPLEVRVCTQTQNKYLLCEFNRDGSSYRSPWSSLYDPPIEGVQPSMHLSKLERHMNNIFQQYAKLYYGTDDVATSVYMWDTEEDGFAACFAIKKIKQSEQESESGNWDSIHQVEVKSNPNNTFTYKVNSSILLSMNIPHQTAGTVKVFTTLQKSHEEQVQRDQKMDQFNFHVSNLGKVVEERENQMRKMLGQVYIPKTKQAFNTVRKTDRITLFKGGKNKQIIEQELKKLFS